MSGYIGAIPTPQATQSRDVYTATSNQTTFTTQGYTPGFVSVYLNGVHLARADYTATNGSDVVLASGATVNDTVEIVSFGTFQSADALPITGGTVTGTVNFPDGSISISDLDIDGGTDIGAALVDADLMVVDDGAGGTNRKATMSRLATYMGTKGLGPTVSTGAASSLPGSPNNGDFWYDSTWGALYMYYTKDGSISYFYDVATSGRHLGQTGAGNYAFGFTQGNDTISVKLHSLTEPGATADHWNDSLVFTHHRKYNLGAIGNTVKAITFGGNNGVGNNVIQMTAYSMVAGNSDAAVDFGDISELDGHGHYYNYNGQPISSPTRGILVSPTGRDGNSYNMPSDVLTYITFDTPSNTTDFGNLTVARSNQGSFASTTRGVIAGGNTGTSSVGYSDVLDYITIASTGNATDFGNLSAGRSSFFCGSNTTRGVTMGGYGGSAVDTMDYYTIASAGNATDFGNLTAAVEKLGVISNGTKSWNGTDIITIATAANATLLSADADYVASYDAFPNNSINRANQSQQSVRFGIAPGWIAATG